MGGLDGEDAAVVEEQAGGVNGRGDHAAAVFAEVDYELSSAEVF